MYVLYDEEAQEHVPDVRANEEERATKPILANLT